MIFAQHLRESAILVAILSGVPLGVAALAGLCVSIFQAVTQIQEQSIGFCVKFISVAALGVIFYSWWTHALVDFLQRMLLSLAVVGRGG